ncbi:hypothetical protein HGRIS_008384 [Hohenbuehelia grisea]|uniref:Histone deacetylase interacting domain-containing protein n=1 Tax=Hohenbuehelia grisea TaxID=104357 RepID=A0ABR3J7S5_9AGAR
MEGNGTSESISTTAHRPSSSSATANVSSSLPPSPGPRFAVPHPAERHLPGSSTQSTETTEPEIPLGSARRTSSTLPRSASSPPGPRHPALPESRSPPTMKRTPKPLTPRPQGETAPGTPGANASSESNRPLNVTDALSYLDAVKHQFQDKPDVYNRFLDIMKDFKSQVIDTPGVIERVSRLFHGNPYLIQGFNTFLPVGYRIDISGDPMDPNTITVTTPSGTTTQSTNGVSSMPSRDAHSLGPGPQAHPGMFPAQMRGIPPPGTGPGGLLPRSMTPHAYHLAPAQQGYENAFSPGVQSHQTNQAASVLGNLNGRNGACSGGGPGVGSGAGAADTQLAPEFNHAIHFLNKIKARYSNDQNTYRQFLDILQTYQKEQRHIHDSQVYVQVQMLFKDAPDLLDEFKDFLPEVLGIPSVHPAGSANVPSPSTAQGVTPPQWTQPEMSSAADKAPKRAAAPKRKKRPVAEKETTPAPPPPPKLAPSRSKKPKHTHKNETGSPSFSLIDPLSPQPPHALPHVGMPPPQHLPAQHAHMHQAGPPSHVMGHSTSTTSPDKLLFFDRAKKALESREIYEEFLKLLSLFSKEVIDVKTLIEYTKVFLGDGDLMAEFKDLIGWDDKLQDVENGPPGLIRHAPAEPLQAAPVDDGEGPSYRRLPQSEVHLACSGRDQLCRSVLNDEWISHPTWASEDAGFLAHKKNTFEEALHKCEEERYEYHVYLEGISRTIAILDPINARIDGMTNEDRASFKLKPNFGGPSPAIYEKILKKVYGSNTAEVLQALQEYPSVAVPVVLSRLKQKDDEWRRAQREWSRAWRETEAKNFYRALDYQGITFKPNDKKQITAKHFVADIETVLAQQTEAREQEDIPTFSRGSVGHQLEYSFQDTPVLHDSLKMIYSFLDHSQTQYSPQERRTVERFLRSFVPLLFMYPAAEFNAACGPLDAAAQDEEANPEPSGHGGDTQRSAKKPSSASQPAGVAAGDLRKKLLKTAQEKSGKESKGSSAVASRVASRAPSPAPPPSESEDVWVQESSATIGEQQLAQDTGPRPFFTNTTFYTLLRLLQVLYSRLLMCKQIGLEMAAQKHRSLFANPTAVELGLDDPNGPSAILAQAMEAMGEQDGVDGQNVVYMYLLDACEKLFDAELDQATFEEHMRWFFGNKAYHVFTLDKLIVALVKQVQTVLSDNKCQELWTLLQQTTQNAETITNQDIIRYRREAERHVGQDDLLYKIQWVREAKALRIQLTGANDPSVDCDGSAKRRWREYVETYVMVHPTEWVPEIKKDVSPIYLRRNARTGDASPATRSGGVIIRISLPSYKLIYEGESDELIWRRRDEEETNMLRERARVRHEERKRSRWLT